MIVLDVNKELATLTFPASKKLNVIDLVFAKEFSRAVDKAIRSAVKVVVITHKGRAFSAGLDLNLAAKPKIAKQVVQLIRKSLERMKKSDKVFIAVIKDLAIGGGFEIALGCDFIFANKGAKLGLPEAKLNLFPAAYGLENLSSRVGAQKALELILQGKVAKAEFWAKENVLRTSANPARAVTTFVKTLNVGSAATIKRTIYKQRARNTIDTFITCLKRKETKEKIQAILKKR